MHWTSVRFYEMDVCCVFYNFWRIIIWGTNHLYLIPKPLVRGGCHFWTFIYLLGFLEYYSRKKMCVCVHCTGKAEHYKHLIMGSVTHFFAHKHVRHDFVCVITPEIPGRAQGGPRTLIVKRSSGVNRFVYINNNLKFKIAFQWTARQKSENL